MLDAFEIYLMTAMLTMLMIWVFGYIYLVVLSAYKNDNVISPGIFQGRRVKTAAATTSPLFIWWCIHLLSNRNGDVITPVNYPFIWLAFFIASCTVIYVLIYFIHKYDAKISRKVTHNG